MEVDGVQRTEAVDAVEVICWQLESCGALQQGVVGQLEGGVEGHRGWESLAAHS